MRGGGRLLRFRELCAEKSRRQLHAIMFQQGAVIASVRARPPLSASSWVAAERLSERSTSTTPPNRTTPPARPGGRQPLKLSASSNSRWLNGAPQMVRSNSSQLVKS